MYYTVTIDNSSTEAKAKTKAKALLKKVQCVKIYEHKKLYGSYHVSFYETQNLEKAEEIRAQAKQRGIECFIDTNDTKPIYSHIFQRETT